MEVSEMSRKRSFEVEFMDDVIELGVLSEEVDTERMKEMMLADPELREATRTLLQFFDELRRRGH